MEKILVLLLITLAVACAAPPDPRGIIINLDEGELCLNSAQCKSGCCQHNTVLGLARCTQKARENAECSPKHIQGVYYRCPCERGLYCEGDRSIIGAITNTNYGICLDTNRSKE
ncbi:PREDICTED: colipase [Dipodomys ordii]|uniref:Colipase n=1 Tax=Dipodomys ordii TaxID=10020 RepID=A0A1S3G8P3_DIPOR|nr:PREDICTED: colipase [Dipodomys ordii]